MEGTMIQVHEPRAIRRALRSLSTDPGAPAATRANAAMWAGRLRRRMGRRDLQAIAWLLRHASGVEGVSRANRRAARKWAAFLQALI